MVLGTLKTSIDKILKEFESRDTNLFGKASRKMREKNRL